MIACSVSLFGGKAQAGYTTMQAKMAGHYESFSRSASKRKRKYKKPSSRSYKKYGKKKTYKKKRYAKQGYAKNPKNKKPTANRKKYSQKSKKYKPKPTQFAALGPLHVPKTKKSLTGGGVRWAASSGCLNGTLKSIIYQVAAKFGSVTVSSTCRSKKRNARVGGAKRSQHLSGNAVDFRVHSNHRAAYAYLKSLGSVGGYKHYGGGLIHIDTGPRRTW